MIAFAEKRLDQRVALELPVRYATDARASEQLAWSTDLSVGGMRLMVDGDVAVGMPITIALEDLGHRAHTVHGEIVRVAQDGGVGVRFVRIEKQTAEYLQTVASYQLFG